MIKNKEIKATKVQTNLKDKIKILNRKTTHKASFISLIVKMNQKISIIMAEQHSIFIIKVVSTVINAILVKIIHSQVKIYKILNFKTVLCLHNHIVSLN